MFKIITLFFIFVVSGQPLSAEPSDPRAKLEKATRQQVIEIFDGDTIVLKDRTRVRLVGIQAPKLPLGRKGFKEWPLATESRAMLSDLTLNKFVTLYYGGESRDRYGRALAHLFLDNGLWIQGELLKSGMARVYSFPDNRSLVPEMMALEQQARLENRGIWALDYYHPKDQAISQEYRNSFQIISGRVKTVAKVRETYYLNFGEDWRDDFTIVIKSKAARLFTKANISPTTYEGKKIEARGWLKSYNGPMIEATHPEQIMIIE